MKLNYVRPYNSINGPVTNVEIADFVVMSGPNGSGKSNLLEAIQQGATEIDGITAGAGSLAPAVRLFALAQLVAVAEGAQSAATFRDRWLQLEQQTKSTITNLTGHPNNLPLESDQLEEHVCNALVGNRQLTRAALDRMLSESGKRLIDFSVDDFRRYSPLIVGVRDPFSMSISELFLTYHQRLERNQFYQWREATKPGAEHLSLTDEEFAATYGPPPWELLNETLSLVGLNYRFRGPAGSEEDLMYEALLVHIDTETEVRTAQLSSGEKTLLAVAMSLYTGSRLGDAIELPKVLLLDEADASLHPSMVQSLLRVLDDIFSQRYGVKVMLTTHAPTTVALAPEESLYTIRRVGSPRLQPASRDEALSSLLVGLPTLSVRNENRRQVFVESEHDEACYQELFRVLRPKLATPLSLEFIASGRGGQGNSDAVKHLVTNLRNSGNPVLGIVDRDDRQGASDGIAFVPARRSLENLVLDPIAVALLLLREGIVSPVDMVNADIRHFELSGPQAQAAADYVISRTRRPGDDGALVTVGYVGGGSAAVPRFVLDVQGHEWEKRLVDTFLPLRQFAAGLKLRVVQRALGDSAQWTPQDVRTLFEQLLS